MKRNSIPLRCLFDKGGVMSVVGWHGCEGVFLRRGNSFEREILFQYFPEEIGESLFERFKSENGILSIEDIHRIVWNNLARASGESAVLRTLFKLDTLFGKGCLQLQFGPSDAPPLARLQVSGNPLRNAAQASCLEREDGAPISLCLYAP